LILAVEVECAGAGGEWERAEVMGVLYGVAEEERGVFGHKMRLACSHMCE
jgi:hypothetical protein